MPAVFHNLRFYVGNRSAKARAETAARRLVGRNYRPRYRRRYEKSLTGDDGERHSDVVYSCRRLERRRCGKYFKVILYTGRSFRLYTSQAASYRIP